MSVHHKKIKDSELFNLSGHKREDMTEQVVVIDIILQWKDTERRFWNHKLARWLNSDFQVVVVTL